MDKKKLFPRGNLGIFMPPGFIESHPSVRLRRLNLRKPLRKAGVYCDFVYRWDDAYEFDNILLSHFNEDVIRQATELKKRGKKLYFCHTEAMFGYPYQAEVFNLCDYIVCCSTKLAELTQEWLTSSHTKCVVIEDMLEEPRPVHQPKDTDKPRAVFCGMGGNSYLAKNLLPTIEQAGMELVLITEHADATIPWNRDTYLQDMANCDVVICPQNVAAQPAKSHVKVATAMGIGMPLICSPNPAYLEIVENGVNGYIADSQEEWLHALTQLKDINKRRDMGQKALETSNYFTEPATAQKWVELLAQPRLQIALINNTLPVKYMSYGDHILDELRLAGCEVMEFRYADVDSLKPGFDAYVFVEVRYNSTDIKEYPGQKPWSSGPRILLTEEDLDVNHLAHFDAVLCNNTTLVTKWRERGFVHIYNYRNIHDVVGIITEKDTLNSRLIEDRKKHNFDIHSKHIDSFYTLQKPEDRWTGGERDRCHITFVDEEIPEGSQVLDIGSADGWLTIYMAKKSETSALEFVKRGIEWTNQHAERHGVTIDLRQGFVEEVLQLFRGKKFTHICAFEILEHLDYRLLPWYLEQFEALLQPGGKVLISLPDQNLNENPEHLWTPTRKLIDKLLGHKLHFSCKWIEMTDHEIPGDWFITYAIEGDLTDARKDV